MKRWTILSALAAVLFSTASACELILGLHEIDPNGPGGRGGGSTTDGGGGSTTDGGGGTTATSPDGGGGTTMTTTTTPTCLVDGMQNGDETGVDCGGSLCPTCELGQPCLAGIDCQSGFCVDGLCCDAVCSGPCVSCDQQGAEGKCTPVPVDTDPNGDCTPGVETCNGMGQCLLINGQPCMSPGACAAGPCADGLCCDKPCDGPCESCDQPGHEGTCRHLPAGIDPDDECTGTDVCNGLGQCVAAGSTSPNGATCLAGMEALCTSMHCVDGVCCQNACVGQKCLACSNALTGFPDGECKAVKFGEDPEDECDGDMVCIGNNVCGPPP